MGTLRSRRAADSHASALNSVSATKAKAAAQHARRGGVAESLAGPRACSRCCQAGVLAAGAVSVKAGLRQEVTQVKYYPLFQSFKEYLQGSSYGSSVGPSAGTDERLLKSPDPPHTCSAAQPGWARKTGCARTCKKHLLTFLRTCRGVLARVW